jgi:hypothetical protein
MLNTFFCCKKQKDTNNNNNNNNNLNKDNKFCLCCYEENITTKPCIYDKCDYTMCKKCYKKYYKLNIKCPACRQINTRIYQKRKTCCCLKRNIPNINRFNLIRRINRNSIRNFINNNRFLITILNYIFFLSFIFGLILLGRFIWVFFWVCILNHGFFVSIFDNYWAPFIFFLLTGIAGLLVLFCICMGLGCVLLFVINLIRIILFICFDDIMDDDW